MGSESSSKFQQDQKNHVLIISVPLHAHFAGIFRQAVELAKRGVTVTFLALEQEIARLRKFSEVQELRNFKLLSYQDSGPPETPGEKWSIHTFMAAVRTLFQPIFAKLVADRKAGVPGPTCIIADRFLTFAFDVARELNVHLYQFWSCGAIFVRSMQACSKLVAEGTLLTRMEESGGGEVRVLEEFEGELKIPGLPALEFRDMTRSSFGVDFTNAIGNAVGEADGLIVNTFYELEAPQIDAIQQSWRDDPRAKSHKLFLVGPVSHAGTFKDRSFVADYDERTDCLKWLDRRTPQSVVYLSFGTMARFSQPEINELALALEASGKSFLWVISGGDRDGLDPNFEERTMERGLIVNWAPQLQILAHPSTGGFVTHCGWNSIIESISCGVPMAAWPQDPCDQFLNCRYLVEVLKIAVEVRPAEPNSRDGECTTLPSGNLKKNAQLEKAVRILMSEEGNSLRERVHELRKKAEAAVSPGGASWRSLNCLVESIPPFIY